jgi:hypothetical protein
MSGDGKLIQLFQEMSDLTQPECAKNCLIPFHCCSPEYCELAIQIAKDEWNTELVRTDHHKLPLMGPNGCTAAPHFRPLCTLHTCAINNWAFKPGDPGWTKRYFKLRNAIDEADYERQKHV